MAHPVPMFGLIIYLWFMPVSVFTVLICTVFDSDIFSLLYLHLSLCLYCLFLCSRCLEVSLLCSLHFIHLHAPVILCCQSFCIQSCWMFLRLGCFALGQYVSCETKMHCSLWACSWCFAWVCNCFFFFLFFVFKKEAHVCSLCMHTSLSHV